MKTQKEIIQSILESLKSDGRYIYYPGVSILPCDHTATISKNDFEFKKVKGTYFTLEDAFILQGVHYLGYATPYTLRAWLKNEKDRCPKKSIPQWDIKKIIGRLIFLAKQGLVAEYDFVTKKKAVMHIYVCNLYGHLYFRNTLDIYTSYDQSGLFRNEMEIFKRLSVNQVVMYFSNYSFCKEANVNLRCVDERQNNKGYIYGSVKLELNEETSTNFLIEPMSFGVNPQIMTQEECNAKLSQRLDKIEEILVSYNASEPTKLIIIVENMDGLKRFVKLIEERNSSVYENAFYTSENVIARNSGGLEYSFLKLKFNTEGKASFLPALDEWEFGWK